MTREQFAARRERAMWKKLSSELKWTEELLSTYADQVNWETISSNENVLWTESLIRRFADKLDWDSLSSNEALSLKSPEIIRQFVLYWHWSDKTSCTVWTLEFIEEMKDYLDWEICTSCHNSRTKRNPPRFGGKSYFLLKIFFAIPKCLVIWGFCCIFAKKIKVYGKSTNFSVFSKKAFASSDK